MLTGVRTITNPVTGGPIDYYEVYINHFQQQIYPNKGPADMVGYDGIAPGPTFLIEKGRESVVRFINNATMATSVHLHGSYSVSLRVPLMFAEADMFLQRAPWDGWAEDLTTSGQFKDYYYPNSQSARFQWYHDHAIDHVRLPHGLAGQKLTLFPIRRLKMLILVRFETSPQFAPMSDISHQVRPAATSFMTLRRTLSISPPATAFTTSL